MTPPTFLRDFLLLQIRNLALRAVVVSLQHCLADARLPVSVWIRNDQKDGGVILIC